MSCFDSTMLLCLKLFSLICFNLPGHSSLDITGLMESTPQSVMQLDNYNQSGTSTDEIVSGQMESTLTSPEELDSFFFGCPSFQEPLRETCNKRQISCAGRCGEFMHVVGRLTDSHFQESVCSCDDFCTLVDDCCWDFHIVCSEYFTRFITKGSRLRGANTYCQEGIVIIEGFGEGEVPPTHYEERKSHLQHVASLGETGLHFRTTDIANSFLFQYQDPTLITKTPNKGLVVWKKQFSSRNPMDLSELEYRIKNGVSQMFAEITDVPPVSGRHRLCRNDVIVECFKSNIDGICQHSGRFLIPRMSVVCKEDYLGEIITDPKLAQSVEEATSLNGQQEESRKCIFRLSSRRIFPQPPYKLKFSFIINQNEKTLQVSEFATKFETNWIGLNCSKSEKDDECKLVAICKSGYHFAFSDCHRATSIFIETTGQDKKAFVFETIEFILFLSGFYPLIYTPTNVRNLTVQGIDDPEVYKTSIKIPLNYNSTVYNPASEDVLSNHLQLLSNRSAVFYQVTVCFQFKVESDKSPSWRLEDSRRLCHKFQSKTGFSPENYEINGTQFSVSQSKAQNHADCNDVSPVFIGLTFCFLLYKV